VAIVLVLMVTAGIGAAVEEVTAAPSAGAATASANAPNCRLVIPSPPLPARPSESMPTGIVHQGRLELCDRGDIPGVESAYDGRWIGS
jgi:hypothetical protein